MSGKYSWQPLEAQQQDRQGRLFSRGLRHHCHHRTAGSAIGDTSRKHSRGNNAHIAKIESQPYITKQHKKQSNECCGSMNLCFLYRQSEIITLSQNGPGWKGPQGSWSSKPPPQAGPQTSTFNTRPGCRGSHSIWPWTPPGTRHPQPLWTACSTTLPLS